MAYTDVISLASAKDYLGVDDTSRDSEITRIINASLSYLEQYTNNILFERDKVYLYRNKCVRVFDHPINTATPTTQDVEIGVLSTTYYDDTATSITLSVGYENISDIPVDLVEVGYNIIEHLFEGKKLTELPSLVIAIMDNYKRFIV
jgi:hypothetical protein